MHSEIEVIGQTPSCLAAAKLGVLSEQSRILEYATLY